MDLDSPKKSMKSMRSMAMGSMRSTKSMKFVELTERLLLVLHHMTTSLLHNSKHGFHGFHESYGFEIHNPWIRDGFG